MDEAQPNPSAPWPGSAARRVRADVTPSGDGASPPPLPVEPPRIHVATLVPPQKAAFSTRHKRRRRSWFARHRVATVVGIGLLAIALLVGTVFIALWRLNSRLGSEDVQGLLGTERPTKATPGTDERSIDPYAGRALNVLVLGTDSREGDNAAMAGNKDPGGQRSDTMFIVHASADRSRVELVSIPRDTLITIPDCLYENGTVIPQAGATKQKFNSAFAYGVDGKAGSLAAGVACAIRTVERISQVPIDGYIVVDFAGFAKIVDAVGGVDLYLPCAISSTKMAPHVELPAGVNHLDGAAATGYARARTGQGLGDGSDLMRIQRQQALFTALAKKVLGMNLLTNIGTLYETVGSVADAMTTDVGNIAQLAGFAYSLRHMSLDDLTLMTIPVGDAGDNANVVFLPEQDQPIWEALRADTPIAPKNPAPGGEPTDLPPASASPTDPSIPPGIVSAPAGQC